MTRINLHEPGPFELAMIVYVEGNGIQERGLTVRGRGVLAEKSHDTKGKI